MQKTSLALFLGLCIAGVLSLAGCAHDAPSTAAVPQPVTPSGARPDVLLIIVDDLNTDLGSYGHAEVRTPHLDRLAASGVRFERAYVQLGLCNPSRTSFLSGRMPETTGVLDNDTPPRTRLGATPFLPEIFRQQGYTTGRVGKILHGAAVDRTEITWDKVGQLNRRGTRQPPEAAYEATPRMQQIRIVETEEEAAVLYDRRATDEAILLGKKLRKQPDRPVFLAVGYTGPHIPFEAPKAFFDLYPPESITPPLPLVEPLRVPKAAIPLRTRKSPPTLDEERAAIRGYYASVSFLDAEIGRLLDGLAAQAPHRELLVVLISDNGYHLGDHGGIFGKLTLFDRALRVPWLIAGPGVAPAVCSRPVELLDLAPTLLDLAGLVQPTGLEGRSLRTMMENPSAPWQRPARSVLAHTGDVAVRARSIVWNGYRYSEWNNGSAAELYDHGKDPDELRNVVFLPGYQAIRQRLQDHLYAWRKPPLFDRLKNWWRH